MRVVVVAIDLSQIASRVAKKDRRFQGVWCTWDPAVRTSGALAFAAQVFDTKRVAESRPLSSSHSSQVMWKQTFSFQMMVRVGRRLTEPLGETDGPNRR